VLRGDLKEKGSTVVVLTGRKSRQGITGALWQFFRDGGICLRHLGWGCPREGGIPEVLTTERFRGIPGEYRQPNALCQKGPLGEGRGVSDRGETLE